MMLRYIRGFWSSCSAFWRVVEVKVRDGDLIDAICDAHGMTRQAFDALPEDEQRAWQLGWVAPMPYPA